MTRGGDPAGGGEVVSVGQLQSGRGDHRAGCVGLQQPQNGSRRAWGEPSRDATPAFSAEYRTRADEPISGPATEDNTEPEPSWATESQRPDRIRPALSSPACRQRKLDDPLNGCPIRPPRQVILMPASEKSSSPNGVYSSRRNPGPSQQGRGPRASSSNHLRMFTQTIV